MNLAETQKALRIAKTELSHLHKTLTDIKESKGDDAHDLREQATFGLSQHCPRYEQEAEELRSGIEELMKDPSLARSIARDVVDYGSDGEFVSVNRLQELLDNVDARDSLAYREREK